MPIPDAKALESAVQQRYGALAAGEGTLSCGAAAELANLREGEVVVDLGCGRGRDLIWAAQKVGHGGRAVGVDASMAMLEKARAAIPAELTHVQLVRSELSALELPDGLADVVISNCAINHTLDKAAVYQELFRVLKPGGRFVVSDIIAVRPLPESVRSDPAAWAACYGGAIVEGEYLLAARAAGFCPVQILRRSEPYPKAGVWLRSLTLSGAKP